jgi:hypothetical protein
MSKTKKFYGCNIKPARELDMFDGHMLRSAYIVAVILPDAVCFADNLFNRWFCVCLNNEIAQKTSEYGMTLYREGSSLIPQPPYIVENCSVRPSKLDWGCFAGIVLHECLSENGTPSSVVRNYNFHSGLFSGDFGFLDALKQLPELDVDSERIEAIYRYNIRYDAEWQAYAATVFDAEVTTSPWGLTLDNYGTILANLRNAFGPRCTDYTYFFDILQFYSFCSLEEFKAAFAEYALVKIDFDEIDARLYQNIVRAAYVFGRDCSGYYFRDSLMGIHAFTFTDEFAKEPNIIFVPLPFKLMLPLYWYTLRKFLLTNASSDC